MSKPSNSGVSSNPGWTGKTRKESPRPFTAPLSPVPAMTKSGTSSRTSMTTIPTSLLSNWWVIFATSPATWRHWLETPAEWTLFTHCSRAMTGIRTSLWAGFPQKLPPIFTPKSNAVWTMKRGLHPDPGWAARPESAPIILPFRAMMMSTTGIIWTISAPNFWIMVTARWTEFMPTKGLTPRI